MQFPHMILSAGHYPDEPGARVDDLLEHDVCAKAVHWLAGTLEDNGVQCHIVPSTRLTPKIGFVNRLYLALNAMDIPTWALEIHCNMGGGEGSEIFHYKQNLIGNRMSKEILTSMTRPSWSTRGVKTPDMSAHGTLGWVEKTMPTALLLELGFMDNDKDRETLQDSVKLYRVMTRVSEGCERATYALNAWLARSRR